MGNMKKYPLVSIIVPVYNAEAYLERCVRSILQQTYENIELILVNDGSTDNSLAACQRFAAEDARVIVIDKPNGGVSDSRNCGIAKARGKYLQFADSDDWLAPEATALLVQRAEQSKCEFVIAPFYRVIERILLVNGHIKEDGKYTIAEFALEMMKAPSNFYYGVMWNKLYRRDIVRENNLQCSPEISWCEDFIFNLQYLCYVKHVYVLQEPIYYYFKRRNSLVATEMRSSNIYEVKRTVFRYYKAFYEAIGLYDDYKGRVNMYMLSVAADSLFRLPVGRIDKDDEEIIFKEELLEELQEKGEELKAFLIEANLIDIEEERTARRKIRWQHKYKNNQTKHKAKRKRK